MQILNTKTGLDNYGNKVAVQFIFVPAGEACAPSPIVRDYDIYRVSSRVGSDASTNGRIYKDRAEAEEHFNRIVLK